MNASITRKLLPFCGLALAFLAPAAGADAGRYKLLHNFSGNGDGAQPWDTPIEDRAGNFYGTTLTGGANKWGTVFKITPRGAVTVLYSFCSRQNCPDGQLPHAGLIADKAGNFYGTATYGGNAAGQGVVFKLAPDGTETVLYSFAGSPDDGQYPYGGLIMDKKGNFYGTTVAGGPDNDGTVFKLAPDGTETVLHSFTNSAGDGEEPMGSLVADKHGNLYGTTQVGGGAYGLGIVFKLTPEGKETIFHTFAGAPSDGGEPGAGLIMDSAGNLYGSTWTGGANNMGSVFRLAPDGTETILHSFAGPPVEGRSPVGGLTMDKSGNLYGATYYGGANDSGTVFQLAPDGSATVLYSFCQEQNCADGGWPVAAPIPGKCDCLYGMTDTAGEYQDGTVYKLK
ncbi:MAG TPA: choice-of-anchor tandem repeat GloVer-containing protein [Rhizomicrobium sp.]|jgi:uncharacterized repeat protein (TIGR03803 family)|nr:choice-of-anchor tandem repeat GloVer-containing protein [Rhizomicrobium sp.]